MPWACGYDGQCYPAANGPFANQADCLSNCQALENKEIAYELHTYLPATAIELAPIDQVAVVRRLTGVPVDENIADQILELIEQRQYPTLAQDFPKLIPWIRTQHPFALLITINYEELRPELQELVSPERADVGYETELVLDTLGYWSNLRIGDIIKLNHGPNYQDLYIGVLADGKLTHEDYYDYDRDLLIDEYNIIDFQRIDYFRYITAKPLVTVRTETLGVIGEPQRAGPTQWVTVCGEQGQYRFYSKTNMPPDGVINAYYSQRNEDELNPPWIFYSTEQ